MRRIFPWRSTKSHRPRCRSRLIEPEAGFTVIEMIVTAAVVAVIAAGVSQALIATSNFSADQRDRTQADAIAQQDQERLKGLSDEALADLSQSRAITLDGTAYTVKSTATFMDTNGGSSCTSKVAAYFRLVSTVTWSEGSGTPLHTITESAIATRPAAGSLLVGVVDQTGAALQGVSITATGAITGGTQSAITDANGCVVFSGLPGLPVQSYNITTAATNFVDVNGNPSTPGVSAAVNGNGIATPVPYPLVMGLAGTINAQFTTWGTQINGTPQPKTATGYKLSYFANFGGNQMAKALSVAAGSPPAATITTGQKLFPFASMPGPVYTNNYQVWAGTCPGEQPAQPPTGANAATVMPGGTASPTVAEPAIDAAIFYHGTPVTPTNVKITYKGTNCPSAGDVWTPATAVSNETVSGTSYGIYPAPFATSITSGAGSSSSGDTGVDYFCADYLTGGRYYIETVTTTATSFTGPSAYIKMDVGTDQNASSSLSPC